MEIQTHLEKSNTYSKERYQKNKAYYAEYHKIYFEQNQVALDEWYKNYLIENKARLKLYYKDYYIKNRQKLLAFQNNYYKESKKSIKLKKPQSKVALKTKKINDDLEKLLIKKQEFINKLKFANPI